MKRIIALCTAAAMLVTLTGCAPIEAGEAPSASLPPFSEPYEAPVGNLGMQYTASWPLYLPSVDEHTLVADTTILDLEHGVSAAPAAVSALLSAHETDRHLRLGSSSRLYPSARYPIEVAGQVCTVQLDASSLSLTSGSLYTAGLALASTLNGLEGIRYVNLLVNERAIGMDLTENLPMGSLSARTDLELPALLDQMEARKTPLGSDPADMPLNTAATLYFPLAGEGGFVPEVRNLSFAGQSVPLLATGLLQALSSGSRSYSEAAAMPDLLSLLAQSPEVSELPGGGRLLTLYFVSALPSRLAIAGVDASSLIGAMVYTLTTFIPSLGAVRLFSGSTLMTTLHGDAFGTLVFEDGLQHRRQYTPGLRDTTTVYLPRGGKLVAVRRTVSSASALAPAVLLSLLSDGPTPREREDGIERVFSVRLDETDLLGIGIENDTVLLNLTGKCRSLLLGLPAEQQQAAVYAIVLTFTEALGARHFRFFFDGLTPPDQEGGIALGGDYMVNHTLLEHARG